MDEEDRFEQVESSHVAIWYAVGLVVGGLIALPALQSALGFVTVGDLGPIARVLVAGVLSIMVVTVGLVGLYQLFILIDR